MAVKKAFPLPETFFEIEEERKLQRGASQSLSQFDQFTVIIRASPPPHTGSHALERQVMEFSVYQHMIDEHALLYAAACGPAPRRTRIFRERAERDLVEP